MRARLKRWAVKCVTIPVTAVAIVMVGIALALIQVTDGEA